MMGDSHEERSHTVTRAVAIIQPFLPQELTGQRVQREATGALGELGNLERNVAFEHKCVRMALHLRRRTKM